MSLVSPSFSNGLKKGLGQDALSAPLISGPASFPPLSAMPIASEGVVPLNLLTLSLSITGWNKGQRVLRVSSGVLP